MSSNCPLYSHSFAYLLNVSLRMMSTEDLSGILYIHLGGESVKTGGGSLLYLTCLLRK